MSDDPTDDGAMKANGGPPDEPAPQVSPLEEALPLSTRSFTNAMGWAAGSRLIQQLISLGVTIVLSRLLLPKDFGLIAMIMVISLFLTVFIDAGLGAAIVQRRTLEPRHLATAFWINLAAGVLLAALISAAAPGIAALYDQPKLTLLTIAVAGDFIISSLGIVPLAMLQREMDFRGIARIQNLSALIGGAAGIAAALWGAGVWSLVIDLLATSLSQTVLATAWGPPRARGGIDRAAARELWSFSGYQTGFQAINYWARNSDNFLIGRFVGPRGLGIYARAYQLMLLPLSQVGFVVNSVLYPALARIQHDKVRLKRAYLRTTAVTALLTFPAAVGLFVVAPDLVRVLFGVHWTGVTPILRILCFASLPQSVSTTTGILYQTQGRTDLFFRWGVISSVIVVAGFGVGIVWGTTGIATSYSILEYPLTYFSFVLPGRLIDMTFGEVFTAVRGSLILALLMGAAVWAVDLGLQGAAPAVRLAVEIAVGVVTYLGAAQLCRLAAFQELRAMLAARRQAV